MSGGNYKNYILNASKDKGKFALAPTKVEEGAVFHLSSRKRKREHTMEEDGSRADRTGDDLVGVVSPRIEDALHKLCDMVFCVDFGGVGACVIGRRMETQSVGDGVRVNRRFYDIVMPWGSVKQDVPEWQLVPGLEWSGAYAYMDPDNHKVSTASGKDTGRKAIPQEKWYKFDLLEAGKSLVDLSGSDMRAKHGGMFPLGIVAPYHVDYWEAVPQDVSPGGERRCSYKHAGTYLMYNARILRMTKNEELYFNENGKRVLVSASLGHDVVTAMSHMQNMTHFEEFEGEQIPVLLFRRKGDGKSRTGTLPSTAMDSPISYSSWEELYTWVSKLTSCVPVRMGDRTVEGDTYYAVLLARPALMLEVPKSGYEYGSHAGMKTLLGNSHDTTASCGDSMHLWEDVHKRSLVDAVKAATETTHTNSLRSADVEYMIKLLTGYARCITDHVRLMSSVYRMDGFGNDQELLAMEETDRMLSHRGVAYARLQAMCYATVSRFLWENGRCMKEMILPFEEMWMHTLKNAGVSGAMVIPYEIVEEALFQAWKSVYEHALKHKNPNLIPSGRNPTEAYLMAPRFRSVYKYVRLPVERMAREPHTPQSQGQQTQPMQLSQSYGSDGGYRQADYAFKRDMDDDEEEELMELEEAEQQDAYVWEDADRQFVDTPNVPVEELRDMWLKNAETERLGDVLNVLNAAYRVIPSKQEMTADTSGMHSSASSSVLRMPTHWTALFGSRRQMDAFYVVEFATSGVAATASGYRQEPSRMLHMVLDTQHDKEIHDNPSEASRVLTFDTAVGMLHRRMQTDNVRFVCTTKTMFRYTLAKYWKAMDDVTHETENYWDEDADVTNTPDDVRVVRLDYNPNRDFLDVYSRLKRVVDTRRALEDAWLIPVGLALTVLKDQYESIMDMEVSEHRYYNSLSRLSKVSGEGTTNVQFSWRAFLTAFLFKVTPATLSNSSNLAASTSSGLQGIAEYWNTRTNVFNLEVASAFRGGSPPESVKAIGMALRKFPFYVGDLYLYHHLTILHYTLYLATFLVNEAATKQDFGAREHTEHGGSAYAVFLAYLDWPLFSKFVRGNPRAQVKDTKRAEKITATLSQTALPGLATLKELERGIVEDMKADAKARKGGVHEYMLSIREDVVDKMFSILVNPAPMTYQEYVNFYENAMIKAADKEAELMELDSMRKRKKQAQPTHGAEEDSVAKMDAAEMEQLETSTVLVLHMPEYTEACLEDTLNMPPSPSPDSLSPYETHLLALRMRNYASLICTLADESSFVPLPEGIDRSKVKDLVKDLLPRHYKYRQNSILSDTQQPPHAESKKEKSQVPEKKKRRSRAKKSPASSSSSPPSSSTQLPFTDTKLAYARTPSVDTTNTATTTTTTTTPVRTMQTHAPQPTAVTQHAAPNPIQPVQLQPKRKHVEPVVIQGPGGMPIVPTARETSIEPVKNADKFPGIRKRSILCMWLDALVYYVDTEGYESMKHALIGDTIAGDFYTVDEEAAAMKEVCAAINPGVQVSTGVLGTPTGIKGDTLLTSVLLLFPEEYNGSYTWILDGGMLSVPANDPWLPKNVAASQFMTNVMKEQKAKEAEVQKMQEKLKPTQRANSMEVLRLIEDTRFGKTWCVYVKKENEQAVATTNLSASTIGESVSYSTHSDTKPKTTKVELSKNRAEATYDRIRRVLAKYNGKRNEGQLEFRKKEHEREQEIEEVANLVFHEQQQQCWSSPDQGAVVAEDMKRGAPWNNVSKTAQKRRGVSRSAGVQVSGLLDMTETHAVNSGVLLLRKTSGKRYLDPEFLLADYGELVADFRGSCGERSMPTLQEMETALQVCVGIPAPRQPHGAWVVANVIAYVVGLGDSKNMHAHVVWNDDVRRRKVRVVVKEANRAQGLVSAMLFKSARPYDIVSEVTLAAPGFKRKYGPSAWWDPVELGGAFYVVDSNERMTKNIRDLVFSRLCTEDYNAHRGTEKPGYRRAPAYTKRPIRVSDYPDVVYMYPKPSVYDIYIPYKWRGRFRNEEVTLEYCAGIMMLANAFLDSGDCDGASVWAPDLEEALEWFMHKHGNYPHPTYDKSELFTCMMEMHGQFVMEEKSPERCVEAMKTGLVERVWVQEHSGRAVVLVLLEEDGPWMAVGEKGNVWSMDMESAVALVGGQNTASVVNDYGMFYILSKFLRQSLAGAQQQPASSNKEAVSQAVKRTSAQVRQRYIRRGHLVRMVYEDIRTMVRVSKSSVERTKLMENAGKLACGQEDPTATYSMTLMMTLLYDAMRRLNMNPRLLFSKDAMPGSSEIEQPEPTNTTQHKQSQNQNQLQQYTEEFFGACASIGVNITKHAPQGKPMDPENTKITLFKTTGDSKTAQCRELPIVLYIPQVEDNTNTANNNNALRLQKVKV